MEPVYIEPEYLNNNVVAKEPRDFIICSCITIPLAFAYYPMLIKSLKNITKKAEHTNYNHFINVMTNLISKYSCEVVTS